MNKMNVDKYNIFYIFYIINQVDKIKEQMNKPSIDQAGKKEGSL